MLESRKPRLLSRARQIRTRGKRQSSSDANHNRTPIRLRAAPDGADKEYRDSCDLSSDREGHETPYVMIVQNASVPVCSSHSRMFSLVRCNHRHQESVAIWTTVEADCALDMLMSVMSV